MRRKEVMKKMVFGKAKAIKKEKTEEVEEQPDLVEDNPSVEEVKEEVNAPESSPQQNYVGMPGFVPYHQVPAQTPATPAVPVAPKPPVAPTPQPEVVNQYQVVGTELVGEGVYRYVLLTNKKLGEIGEVYEF